MSKYTGTSYTEVHYGDQLIRKGWRNPLTRMNQVDLDFTGKTVLDLGCNCGGTLFAVADKISQGWGVDKNAAAIGAAIELSEEHEIDNLTFNVVDLQVDEDIAALPSADILFALSISKHISSWRDLIAKIQPDVMVFEANGGRFGGDIPDQLSWLYSNFEDVELLLEDYESTRKLLLCKTYLNEE